MKAVLIFAVLLLLSACREQGIQPDLIFEDAHGSGNIVAVDEASRLAVSGGLEGSLRVWDLSSRRSLMDWRGHQGTVNGLYIQSDPLMIVSGGWDGRLVQWDKAGKAVRQRQTPAPITAMAFSGHRAWSGHDDGSVRQWSLDGFELLQEWKPSDRRITALAAAGGKLAVADHGGRVRMRQDQDWIDLGKLPAYARTLAFDDQGARLFAGSWFYLYRWDLPDPNPVRLGTDHRGIIVSLAWSPARQQLMSISRQTDSAVLALDPQDGATRQNFGKHDLCGASVAVSADGRYLISTSDDASVRIWDLGESR